MKRFSLDLPQAVKKGCALKVGRVLGEKGKG